MIWILRRSLYNMKRQLTLLLMILLAGFTHVYAQPLLTVEEAVAAALEKNYEIQLSRNDSLIYALNLGYAKAAFLPRVNASAATVFNNNNLKQRLSDGSERNQNGIRSNNIASSVNMNWTVFDGLKMFITRDKLKAMAGLGNLGIENQLENTIADVIITYYNIVQQKQQLLAIEEQMTLNEERATVAEKKLSVGLGAKPDVLQAKLDINAQKAARLRQLNLIEQLKETLNLLMAVKPGTAYQVSDSIPFDDSIIVTDVLNDAAAKSPALLLAQKQIEIANFTLRERKAERYPTVNLNAAYNFSRTENQLVVNNFTPLLNRNQGFNYGISANIPIFNNYNVKRNIQLAQMDINYQQLQYDLQRYRVENSVVTAYKNYELQRRMLSLEQENIIIARENVYIASERFRLGVTTSLELREAQKSLADAYYRLITARYNAKVAETELLRLKGDLVK